MTKEISIIGAGISGLVLALTLHRQNLPSRIYESRPSPLNIGGAVMLSPNSLRILDNLGVYEKLLSQGYSFDTLFFRTVDGVLRETYEFGSEQRYGYRGLRVYRWQLIDALLEKVRESGVEVVFGCKFERVVEEKEESVVWESVDGATHTSSLLIGADGIHSRVRRYIYPDLVPRFTGLAGITAAVPTSQLKLPSPDYAMPVTIVQPSIGAFVIAPQQPDGSEVLIGKQKRIAEHTREGWDKIHADKDASIAFLRENAEAFGELVVSATSNIPKDKINVWPFYVIPKLPSWASEKKRVFLLGDAAHAVPPSSGQGISQAVEDTFMLSLLLAKGKNEDKDLAFWQEFRQARLEEILLLNARVDRRRLPKVQGEIEEDDEEGFDLEWLYGIDIEAEVERYLAGSA